MSFTLFLPEGYFMKSKKALLSLLLAFCIVVGMVPAFGATAFAANSKVIKRVNITDLDAPVAGEAPDTEVTVTTNCGSDVFLTVEVVWQMYTYYKGSSGKMTSAVFDDSHRYCAFFGLIPKDGYKWADDVEILVNGIYIPVSYYRFDGETFPGRSGKLYFGEYTYKNGYTIRFDLNGVPGEAPEAQTVLGGRRIERPADPTAEGYNFVGWYIDAACTRRYNFTMVVSEDQTVYAKWEPSVEGVAPAKSERFRDEFEHNIKILDLFAFTADVYDDAPVESTDSEPTPPPTETPEELGLLESENSSNQFALSEEMPEDSGEDFAETAYAETVDDAEEVKAAEDAKAEQDADTASEEEGVLTVGAIEKSSDESAEPEAVAQSAEGTIGASTDNNSNNNSNNNTILIIWIAAACVVVIAIIVIIVSKRKKAAK